MLGGRPNTLRSVPCALPRCGARQLRGGARHGAWFFSRKLSREQRLQVSAHKQPANDEDGEKSGDKKSETEGDRAQKDTGKEAAPEQSKPGASAQTDKRSSAPSSDAEDDWGKPSSERLRFIGAAQPKRLDDGRLSWQRAVVVSLSYHTSVASSWTCASLRQSCSLQALLRWRWFLPLVLWPMLWLKDFQTSAAAAQHKVLHSGQRNMRRLHRLRSTR